MSQYHLEKRKVWVLGLLAVAAFSVSKAELERMITIGGAATEIVWALGAGEKVVAVDTSSTWPEEVRELPQVGYVRSISPEGVVSMGPDLIVATGALGPPPAREMMDRLGVPVLWLPDPTTVEDVRESIEKVASRLGLADRGEGLWREIEARLSGVADEVSRRNGEAPRVLFFLDPPSGGVAGMAGGADSRADTLIALVGGVNAASGFRGFQPVSWEGILQMNPDVILVGESEGHGGSPAEIQALRENPRLRGVAAIRNGAVFGVPLDDLAFGPRIAEAAERWFARIHGEGPHGNNH